MKIYGEIKTLTKESIKPYGLLCEHINQKDDYEPLVKVTSRGWIWAILTFKNKSTDYIECHPTSKESFEPMFGTSLIILAESKTPEKHEIFLLDQAIMLNEGVWHNVLTISDVSRVKITENNANSIIKLCYDVIMELVRAKMIEEGYNATGQGAHEAEVAYARILGFAETDVRFLDKIRYYRNGILYYGKEVDEEYAIQVITFTERVHPKLLKLIGKRGVR